VFKFLKENIPHIDKKQVPFVVNQEPGLKKAIQDSFPNSPIIVVGSEVFQAPLKPVERWRDPYMGRPAHMPYKDITPPRN
jgi:hypothetical protein